LDINSKKNIFLMLIGLTFCTTYCEQRVVQPWNKEEDESVFSVLTPLEMYVQLALSLVGCCCGCTDEDDESSDVRFENRKNAPKIKKS